MITIPTYPARPINGGRLELASAKRGNWLSECKWNGWRAEVHTPTGLMWNRHGKPLSIAREFTSALAQVKGCGIEWLDVEALERRHNIGRGTLIVLDAIVPDMPYEQRKAMVSDRFPVASMEPSEIGCDSVCASPFFDDAAFLYESLKKHSGFFEGIVMKRSQSPYPFQLRSDAKETLDWVKHRFI